MKLITRTTSMTYTTTLDPEQVPEDTESLAETVSKTLGGKGDRHFTVNDDEKGWVALNPAHVIAVEFIDPPKPFVV